MYGLIIVLGLIGAASALPRNPRIVGGEETSIERYPFIGGLYEEWEGVFSLGCGSTLITPTALVSAAHCLDGAEPYAVKVRLGTNKVDIGGVEHAVSKLTIHPEYNLKLFLNDIIVIRLRDAVAYTEQIRDARIAGPRYILPDDTVVYAAGWGDTQYGGPSSPILKHVAVNTINHQICTERYAHLKTQPGFEHAADVTSEMMCIGILDVGGKDACHGDSGGPVIHNGDILVGITSWGYKCAHSFYPGVSVRVSSYTSWINKTSIQ